MVFIVLLTPALSKLSSMERWSWNLLIIICCLYLEISFPGWRVPGCQNSQKTSSSACSELGMPFHPHSFLCHSVHREAPGYNSLSHYCRRNTSTVMTWSCTTCFIIFTRSSRNNEIQSLRAKLKRKTIRVKLKISDK